MGGKKNDVGSRSQRLTRHDREFQSRLRPDHIERTCCKKKKKSCALPAQTFTQHECTRALAQISGSEIEGASRDDHRVGISLAPYHRGRVIMS